MKLKLLLTSLFALSVVTIYAGTIIYKTSKKGKEHRLAKVKIISISGKTVTIKHGKGVRTIPLSYLSAYYNTDIDSGDFEDNTCDYSVSVNNIIMPETGYSYTKSKKTKKKSKSVSNCEIEFSIRKKTEKGKTKSIRMPYFYLFILTSGSKSYGKRPIYSFYYPDEAKVKSSTYDEAKMIEATTSMDRPRMYHGNKSSFTGRVGKISSASGNKPIIIPMSGIRTQKIIAYHLEVWGKDKKIVEKNWKGTHYKISKNWWKRY